MRTPDKILRIILALTAISMFFSIGSCKKDDPAVGFSKEIEELVPQSIIDDLRKNGMQIYEGKVPPKIEGTYLFSPYVLTKRFSDADGYEIGKIIDSYKYKFYNLTSNNQKVSIDFLNLDSGDDSGKGQGAYISGNGNFFTIFSEIDAETRGIKNKMIQTFSGELSAKGIANLQTSITLKYKDSDPDGKLIPVGATRIFKDGDGISEKTSNFRLSVPSPVKNSETNCSACANPAPQTNK